MSIASELENLQQDITNARTAITTKGGTITTGGGSSQLATDIATIPTGITPSGNISLTASTSTQTGIDVTSYATASVAPTPSETKTLILGSTTPSTVTPTSGKLLSSVPVTLDTSVIKAENIAKDVQMLGITGTHEGGSARVKDISPITANGTYQVQSDLIIVDSMTLTGQAYCNTDITPPDNPDWNFEADFIVTTTVSGSDSNRLFGTQGTSVTNKFSFSQRSTYFNIVVDGVNCRCSVSPVIGTEYTAIFNGSSLTVNGTAGTREGGETGCTSPMTLDLFACHNNDDTHTDMFTGTFKYLKLDDYWFVPARKSDNTPVIYEKNSGKVYTITGTGITLGSDVSDESYVGFKSPLTVNISSLKYGASINGLLGDIDASGNYQAPSENTNLTFTGVISLPTNSMVYKFYKQSNIKAVSFPNLTTINSYALQNAFYQSGVTSFSAPNLTTIQTYGMNYTFYGCSSLDGDVLLNSLTNVGGYGLAYAFYNCTNLDKFSATSLASLTGTYTLSYAFYGCSNLKEIHIPNISTISGNYALQYLCYNCRNLETADIIIPNNTYTYVLRNAFTNCSSLTTPPTVNLTDLKSYAMYYCFSGCSNLTTFTFPELLTISGTYSIQYCFNNCTALTNVTFTKLTSITQAAAMSYCFQNCTGGLSVYFPALTTLTSGQTFQNTWKGANNAHIYFPALTVAGFGSSKTHFSNACTGATGITLHFPAAVQSTVEALTNYPNFGGTNTTVLFDL